MTFFLSLSISSSVKAISTWNSCPQIFINYFPITPPSLLPPLFIPFLSISFLSRLRRQRCAAARLPLLQPFACDHARAEKVKGAVLLLIWALGSKESCREQPWMVQRRRRRQPVAAVAATAAWTQGSRSTGSTCRSRAAAHSAATRPSGSWYIYHSQVTSTTGDNFVRF